MIIWSYGELFREIRGFTEVEMPLLVISSEGGLGKTFSANAALENISHTTLQAHATPGACIHRLYRNRDCIVKIDDVDGFFQNTQMKALMKMLCEIRKNKTIYWDSTSPIFNQMEFPFNGRWRVIALLNNIGRLDADLRAVLTRGIYLDFRPSQEEVLRQLKTWYKDEEVLEYMEGVCGISEKFNFRMAEKAHLRRMADLPWKEYIEYEAHVHPKLKEMKQLKEMSLQKDKHKIEEWKNRTGGSKADYYRWRNKYEQRSKD
jgi:hypothetical protein